jgi:hypothetical protein
MSTAQAVSLLDKIRNRGYWRVIIRPATFIEKRIPNISALYPLVEKKSVRLRGWDYPHVDSRIPPHTDVDWVGQEFEWDYHLELWRLYQSGQFVHIFGMVQDWRDQSKFWPAGRGWRSGAILDPKDTVYYFTEIIEFATRLSLTEAGDDQMHIEIETHGLQDRILQYFNDHGQFSQPYRASVSSFPYPLDLSRTDLIAEPKKLALDAALELFRRFGWDPSRELLRALQESIGR